MASATAIALTLTPILCTLLLRGKFHSEDQNPVMRFLQRLYRPRFVALDHRSVTLGLALAFFLGAVLLASGVGSEFMPPLNEGDIMFMPSPMPASPSRKTRICEAAGRSLSRFPEVAYVGSKGRARGNLD